MATLKLNIPSMIDSVPSPDDYKSVTDRYFTRHYCLNVNDVKNNDFMLLFHSNRITLLALAPTHPFFKTKGKFKLNYMVGKTDRTKNVVQGKGKKGGQHLVPSSVVCTLEMEDGTNYPIPSCLKGTLVEVNEQLINSPNLLRQFPDAEGYIAIILSRIEVSKARKNELVSHEDYIKICIDS